MAFAGDHIPERAARPKHIEILPELPKTAVGKIFKPDRRKLAITRIYDDVLAGTGARVETVREDKKRGLVAYLTRDGAVDEAEIRKRLGQFTTPWDWA